MRGVAHLFTGALATNGLLRAAAPATPANGKTAVLPGVVPTAPGPNDVFNEGEECVVGWIPDQSGLWKEVNIELMSGPNSPMVHITTLKTFDGTDASKTSYTYPCPDVEPNSAIYFYQFSSPAAPQNLTWTTRFTLAAADGSVTPPANKTQPNGDPIPWGTGALKDPSKAVPPPSYLGEANPSTTTTSSGSSTASSLSSAASSSSSAAPSSSSSASSAPSTTASSVAPPTETTSSPQTTVMVTSTQGNTPAPTNTASGALAAQANLVLGAVMMALTAVAFGVMS